MAGQLVRVLQEVWGNREGYVFLPTRKDGRWQERGASHAYHGEVPPLKIDMAVDNYFSPLVFAEPRRLKEHALPTHVLWADLDEAAPEKCRLQPSIAWKTTQGGLPPITVGQAAHLSATGVDLREKWGQQAKPHYQGLWLLSDGASPEVNKQWGDFHIGPTVAADLSRRIAYAEAPHGADRSGWDITQVLRLPGTLNHKHTPPQRIELLYAKRLYYTLDQVRAAYPPVPKPETSKMVGWIEFDRAQVDAAVAKLPVGVQMALERPYSGGADRSLEVLRLAETLLRFKADPLLVPHILLRSPVVRDKYEGRSDFHERVLTATADAMIAIGE